MVMIFHHGGSDTAAYALRSGVPSCEFPFVFDRFYWDSRTAQLRVELRPIPIRKLTPGNLLLQILFTREIQPPNVCY